MAGLPGFVTTDNTVNTRFKAPVLSGQIAGDVSAAVGPIPVAGGFMCIQSTAAILNQVVTTSATGLARASFFYIPVTTGTLTGAAAPPFVGVGTPITWNDNSKMLQIWSSGSASWMSLVATTSMAAGGFTTSF